MWVNEINALVNDEVKVTIENEDISVKVISQTVSGFWLESSDKKVDKFFKWDELKEVNIRK